MKITFKYLITLLFLLASIATMAQQKDNRKVKKKYYDWGSLGMGWGITEMQSDINTPSFALTYNHSFGEQKIFWQGNIVSTLYGEIPSLFAINSAVGYAIGFHRPFLLAFSIGPGYMSGFNQDGYRYRGLGANTTVQFHFKPLNDFGAGVELFFNIPFAGTYSNLPMYNGIRVVVAISKK